MCDSSLQPKDRTALKMLDSGSEGTQIEGLKELPVKSPEEIMALLQLGEAHRHYGSTSMNERSVMSTFKCPHLKKCCTLAFCRGNPS